MDLEIKKQLLEMLMADMDKAEVSKLKPKPTEPVAVIEKTESEVVPVDKLKQKMKDVMAPDASEKEEEEFAEVETEEEAEDIGDSRLLEKLRALKEKKGMDY